MFVAELRFVAPASDEVAELIDFLLSALRQNGQVCGDEFAVVYHDAAYSVRALIPAYDALDSAHNNFYVERDLAKLRTAGVDEPTIRVLDREAMSANECDCSAPAAYILYTTYVSLESPLRCGDCFLPLPLYRIPPTYDHEYYDIMGWQSDYQACDHLWMNDHTLVRATYRQLAKPDSSLARQGRAICHKIQLSSGIPTYYYLFHFTSPQARLLVKGCPECGNNWRLAEPWHDLFDLRCDHCLLLARLV